MKHIFFSLLLLVVWPVLADDSEDSSRSELAVSAGIDSPELSAPAATLSQVTEIGPVMGMTYRYRLPSGTASFETGLSYSSRTIHFEGNLFASHMKYSLHMNCLEVPAMMRIHLMRDHLSFGGGFFASYGIGNMGEESYIDGVAVEPSRVGYESSMVPRFDWGFVGSVQGQFPIGEGFAFFVDGRALIGMKSWTSFEEQEQHLKHFRVLAGVSVKI